MANLPNKNPKYTDKELIDILLSQGKSIQHLEKEIGLGKTTLSGAIKNGGTFQNKTRVKIIKYVENLNIGGDSSIISEPNTNYTSKPNEINDFLKNQIMELNAIVKTQAETIKKLIG